MLGTPPPSDDNGGVARQESQRWTFVEEDLEEVWSIVVISGIKLIFRTRYFPKSFMSPA